LNIKILWGFGQNEGVKYQIQENVLPIYGTLVSSKA